MLSIVISPLFIFCANSIASSSMPDIISVDVLFIVVPMSINVLMYCHMACFVLSEMLLFHIDFTSMPGILTMSKNVSSLAVTR
ncbi:hypothetical protein PBCV1_a409R [Paramecium bursaria Chlorella virus 1]|uniref:Uncharacterized protein n=1 Tax=Paramecium bursaria Chlorella virus 1 TaxID=10506 RepID=Q98461_PBCV1|nr:hypothetical protein PBCV1_a409R [Paramecium bursaria Chlorella virus 1]AAC96777.1 hypothetical protein [Paramecium bursaria Chlorella virus 1]